MTLSSISPSSESVAEEVVLWEPPELSHRETPSIDTNENQSAASARQSFTTEEIEQRMEQVREEGRLAGFAQGEAQAHVDATTERNNLNELILSLNCPLSQINEEVMQELLSFALMLAKMIIKRELSTDGEYYLELIKRVCTDLLKEAKPITISLHPEDVSLIESCIATDGDDMLPKLIADPELPKGSCLLESSSSFIDAGLDVLIERVALGLKSESTEQATDIT